MREQDFRLHLVCFASGSSVHFLNRDALIASARKHDVDDIHSFEPGAIDPALLQSQASILNQKKGGGYWLWKPYFILRTMTRAAEGDWIVYVDSGATIRSALRPLCQAHPEADEILFLNDYFNRDYCKRDSFVLMGVDTPEFHDTSQLDASLIFLRNNQRSRQFVEDWLTYCMDGRILTDDANRCGLSNLPGFVVHRHDQSVLSLLFWRERPSLRYILFPRSYKHRLIAHHRRRTDRMPIWLWHLSHDFFESFFRRMSTYANLR